MAKHFFGKPCVQGLNYFLHQPFIFRHWSGNETLCYQQIFSSKKPGLRAMELSPFCSVICFAEGSLLKIESLTDQDFVTFNYSP